MLIQAIKFLRETQRERVSACTRACVCVGGVGGGHVCLGVFIFIC